MSKFSVAVWVAFSAYLSYTVYNMAQLMVVPGCDDGGGACLKPYIYADGANVQAYLYFSVLANPSAERDMTLLYHVKTLGVGDEPTEEVVHFSLPSAVRVNNKSLHLHMFHTHGTKHHTSWTDLANSRGVGYNRGELVVHFTPPPKPFSLVGDNSTEANTAHAKPPQHTTTLPSPHLHTVITVAAVTEPRHMSAKLLPADLRHKTVQVGKHYLPLLHIDTLAQRQEDLMVVAGVRKANVTIRLVSTSMPKLRLWLHLENSLKALTQFGFTEKDADELKGVFDTNLYLLGVTVLVSLLHLTFDILAFKNDISFWRGCSNMTGLSTGTVLWRCVAQIIIFLSLLNDSASLLILAPAGVGVVVEAWKVTKALGNRALTQSAVQAKAVQETKDLDSIAFRYLSYLMLPILVLGAWYSLLYVPHTSWYSWCITSLVHGVYALGFLFMLPQLFINYKLKSVAHLPWRAFTYKAFNTFIDDLFAFVIKMPTSHRLACFRDDIVFLVYLYQRYLYRVDMKRVNEFGGGGEEVADKSKKE